MKDTNLGNNCKYASECPIYQGKEKYKDMPLYLMRNVFCHRGYKGWKNCERYTRLEEESNTENTPINIGNKSSDTEN